MAESVKDRDLRGLLGVIDAARSTDVAAGLPPAVLERVRALVACDMVSFVEFDSAQQITFVAQGVGDDGEENDIAGDETAFWTHYWDCLACSYPDRSGDDRSVTMLSDFYTPQQWHSTGIYSWDYLYELGENQERFWADYLQRLEKAGAARD